MCSSDVRPDVPARVNTVGTKTRTGGESHFLFSSAGQFATTVRRNGLADRDRDGQALAVGRRRDCGDGAHGNLASTEEGTRLADLEASGARIEAKTVCCTVIRLTHPALNSSFFARADLPKFGRPNGMT